MVKKIHDYLVLLVLENFQYIYKSWKTILFLSNIKKFNCSMQHYSSFNINKVVMSFFFKINDYEGLPSN